MAVLFCKSSQKLSCSSKENIMKLLCGLQKVSQKVPGLLRTETKSTVTK